MSFSRSVLLVGVTVASLWAGAGQVGAETMSSALERAYSNNPDINQQRAALRARDEGVPTAKAGYMPKVNGSAQAGYQTTTLAGPLKGSCGGGTGNCTSAPQTYGVTVTQTVFDGLRTPNSVSQAESAVLAQREALRQAEVQTLQAAAAAYMDVLRDTAVLGLRRSNIKVLQVQLQQTQDRFHVGEVTRTDVAQAESALAGARADFATAQSNLQTSMASFRRQIGVEPKELQPAQPIEKLLPPGLQASIDAGLLDHPSIVGAMHQVDMAESAIKVAEGALAPQLGVQGSFQKAYNSSGIPGYDSTGLSVMGTLTVPIYQGGSEYAAIRAAKEQLGQARLAVDSQRIVVRGAVSTSWGQLQAARAAIMAYQASVRAAEVALNGVREEAKVGQRTTLDVLNAQQALLNSRVQLVTAQHDRVVASYAVMSAIGHLTAEGVGLGAVAYNPEIHYNQTKNRFFGVSTSDGR